MSFPSNAHLLAFGRVVHYHAAVESGIKIALSGILNIHLGEALIAFRPYGATDLKNVAKSLAKEKMEPDLAHSFGCIVGDWAGHAPLRNAIAHCRWTSGERPGSIKVRDVQIREGRAQWIGDEVDEKDYTAQEMDAVAEKLHQINERLKTFVQTSGLRAIIDKHMSEAKAKISASSGNDTKSDDR